MLLACAAPRPAGPGGGGVRTILLPRPAVPKTATVHELSVSNTLNEWGAYNKASSLGCRARPPFPSRASLHHHSAAAVAGDGRACLAARRAGRRLLVSCPAL